MKDINKNINKTELKYILYNRLNGKVKCTKTDMYKIVDELFNTIEDELVKGNTVNITNFGKFRVNEVAGHYGINPLDPTEPIKVDKYKKVCFKTGKSVKDKLNK